MNPYVIFTDSAADLPADLIVQHDIRIVPMTYLMNGVEHTHTLTPEGWDFASFWTALHAPDVTVSTSQIIPATYQDCFAPILEAGQDVLYCCFSSGLSSTWQSAQIAAQELAESFPGRRVICVDTKAATGGQGQFVLAAAENRANGMTVEENAAWLNENCTHFAHWFTVNDLDFLKRGGRVSKSVAFFGGKLQIKPVMHVDEEGKLAIVRKARGRETSLAQLAASMQEQLAASEAPRAWICHVDAQADAESLAGMIRKFAPDVRVELMPMSPIIAAHTGPGAMAIFFWGKNR